MDLGIEGRVAVVAGGSRGCGYSISRALAAEGAKVLLTGRQSDIVDGAAKQIRDEGGSVHGLVADMTTAEGVDEIVGTAREVFGPVGILVVNSPHPPEEYTTGFDLTSDDHYRAVYEFYVLSQVRLARAVLPDMTARNWGRLLNIASVALKTPLQEDDGHYAKSVGRMGVAPLMRILSQEFGRRGITANTIATGPFDTEAANAHFAADPENRTPDRYGNLTAVGRRGHPDEMGALAAYLCSSYAGFLTGEVIRLDGGYSKSLF